MVVLALAESSIQLVPDGSLILHVVVILLMVGVLNLTLYKPINRVLAERESRTRGRRQDARQVLATVEEKLSGYEQTFRSARAEGYLLLEQERASALRDREVKLASLKQELSSWTAEEKAAVERQASRVRKELGEEANAIALRIGSQILRRPIENPQTCV